MSTIAAIIGGLFIAFLFGNADKKHKELTDHLESTPLPEAENVVEIASKDLTAEQKPVQATSKADTEEERKKYIIEQKMHKAYEIWALRKKVIPIAAGSFFLSIASMFMAYAFKTSIIAIIFPIISFLGIIGTPIYLVAKIGSKNQQYSLLVQDLKKEGYSHSDLKAQFRTWYYNLG